MILAPVAILLLLAAGPSPAPAADPPEAPAQEPAQSADPAEQGRLSKETGDRHAAAGDYEAAAEPYLRALALARDRLSIEERVEIATRLSWAKRHGEAIDELTRVLAIDPANRQARLQLARTLAWAGRNEEALREVDTILAKQPGDPEALLVRAHVLRWGGSPEEAIPIYREVLDRGENFEARIGLAHALLAVGRIPEARESRSRLVPGSPYQEKELQELDAALRRVDRFRSGAGLTYYRDTDENRVSRYRLFAGRRWGGRWDAEASYRHTDAKDPFRDNRAEEAALAGSVRWNPEVRLGGSAGAVWFGGTERSSHGLGALSGEWDRGGARAAASASYQPLLENAELIENRIRYWELSALGGYSFRPRMSLEGRYARRDYSDDNSSDDLRLTVRHRLPGKDPVLGFGYRFRFLDFAKETGSGYFDPSRYTSHHLLLSLYGERGRWYGYAEPYLGYESFTRGGSRESDVVAGGSAAIGARIGERASAEVSIDGGDDSGGSASGFSYYQVGATLSVFF